MSKETVASASHAGVRYWHEVEPGFWVGNDGGGFLGTIERLDRHRFVVRDSVSTPRGEFPSVRAARLALEAEALNREERRA